MVDCYEMRFAYEQHVKLIPWSSLEDKACDLVEGDVEHGGASAVVYEATCAVGEMPRSVIQSLANQPMDVPVELDLFGGPQWPRLSEPGGSPQILGAID